MQPVLNIVIKHSSTYKCNYLLLYKLYIIK